MEINKGMTTGRVDTEAIDRDLDFSEQEYADRLDRIRRLMASAGIDLLYATTPEVVCYLHGYYISWYKANSPRRNPQLYGTAIHVDHDHLIHFDNPTEVPVLKEKSVSTDNRFFPSRDGRASLNFVIGELKSEGWLDGTVGLEYWSYVPNRAVSDMMEAAFRSAGCSVADASGITREVRRIKSPQEIRYIERAVELADVGHQAIMDHLRPGISELALFGEVTRAMTLAGSEISALIPIFTSVPIVDGVPQANGHSMASRRIIRDGEILIADLCGVVNRYHGNVCRGYFVGGGPPDEILELYEKAAGAYSIVEMQTRAGMTLREFSSLLIDYYKSVGLWGQPGWSIGYELGLSLPPDWVGEFYFSIDDDPKYMDRVLDLNMVTNFEVVFNTAFVDTIVFEAERTRVLSKSPRELIVVK